LNVEDDSTTSITFCNVRDTGTLTILKNVDTDGDGDVDVFGSGDWTWDVMNGPQNTATGSSQTLVTGPYTVSEDQQPGYHVTDFSCGETSFGAVEEIGVTLTNADLTCTFTNALTVTTIGLTKSAPATTVPGGQLVYALGWSVNGNSSATNATIEDALPANTTFVSADCGTTIGTCSAVNLAGTVTWSLGTRSPGENGTVTLTVAVTNPLANGMTIPNLATFDTSETGPVEANATTTVVSAPILTIEKSVDVSFVNPGKTATYTVVITNTGNDTAHNVILTDALPAGLVFTEGGGVTKTFAIGELAPGASTSVRYDVSVAGDLAPGFYDNLATVKADNDDPISDTARLEVRAPAVLSGEAQPELRIKKTVDRDLTNPGATLLYTVTVKNIGEAIAENVKIVDQLPNGLSFVSNSETNHTWKLGDIPAGESRAVTYKVKVNSSVKSGTYTNIATASARDLNPVSDEANVDVRIPAVLGAETALPETGFGGLDWMITFFLLVCISVGLGLLLQPVTDESALER
jgi:uncharacterized repeat protein (TIGR01451 family)